MHAALLLCIIAALAPRSAAHVASSARSSASGSASSSGGSGGGGGGSRLLRGVLSLTPHLFLDLEGLANSTNISVSLGTPVKAFGAPAVVPTYAWEHSLHFYTSLVTVPPVPPSTAGSFMLFYNCLGADAMYLCLATSSDGVAFSKPLLNFYPWTGGEPTNRVFRSNDTASWPDAVFIDGAPGVPAAERFKLTYEGGGALRVLYVATSPDGLAWSRRVPEEPVIAHRLFADTDTAMLWDGARGVHVAFGRADLSESPNATAGCEGNYPSLRRVLMSQSATGATGNFSTPVQVLGPGAPDAFNCLDLYNPAPTLLPDGTYLLFPSSFRHFSWADSSPPFNVSGNITNDGVLDIRLAVSRDGANFSFVARDAFLPRGTGYRAAATGAFSAGDSDPDAGFVFATSAGILDADALAPAPPAPVPPMRYAPPSKAVSLLYFGTQRTHTGPASSGAQGVLRATLRREGFASLRTPAAGNGDGVGAAAFTTLAVSLPSPASACSAASGGADAEIWLMLNAAASVAGGISVELRDAASGAPLPGRAAADAAPFIGDAVRAPAAWRSADGLSLEHDLAPWAGRDVVLDVSMLHAQLWAWQLVCVPPL